MRTALLALLLAGPVLADCGMDARADVLATEILGHPDQQRTTLVCDPRLVAYAAARAEDMATRGFFGHVTPENLGPNALLTAMGFPLPDGYPLGRNNSIESLVGGLSQPAEVLDQLLRSSRHRPQITGSIPFFREQDRYGIAYLRAPETPEVDIWVIVFAREGSAADPELDCTPPPGECFTRDGG